jgi:hypothetical protein
MRRVEQLITEARKQSQNERYDANSGLSQSTFVQYFQNAHDTIMREAVNTKSKFLLKDKTVDVVYGQEKYPFPSDIYLYNIDTVEWSENNQDWITLSLGITKDRFSGDIGYPFAYIPRSDGILFAPVLQSGFIRYNYIKKLNNLGIRMGKISAVTASSTQVTALTIDTASASYDGSTLADYNYLCVVDRDGNQTMKNLAYDSINVGTGVITMSPFTFEDGETISTNDYVIAGKNVTNLPEWPDTFESYLIKYAVYEARLGDSSSWTKAIQDSMASHLSQLISSLSRLSDDFVPIPIINSDYLTFP